MTPKETIIDQSRKLFIVLSDYVDKMPRNLKFTVGDRIITNNLDLMECQIEAYYGNKSDRLAKINKANVKLEIVRQIMRYLFETNRDNREGVPLPVFSGLKKGKHEYYAIVGGMIYM